MVILPPISSRNNDKIYRKGHRSRHIKSKIFKNGATWFDLDTFVDPYSSRWQKYIPLHEQSADFIDSKKELADKRILYPLIAEFDESKVEDYREKEPLDKRRDLYRRLSEVKRKERALKQEWKKIEEDEVDFKTSVETYSNFIVGNKIKREVSFRKIEFYREKIQELNKESNQLRIESETLRLLISKMRENSKKHMIFYEFCEEAARLEGMQSPLSIVNRYLNIKETEEFVYGRLLEMLAEFTANYGLLKKYHADKDGVIRHLKLQYNEKRIRYEEAFRKAAKSQKFHNTVMEKCDEIMRQHYQSFHAVCAVYERVRKRNMDEKYIPQAKIADRLVFISRNIEKLEGIRQIAHRLIDEEEERQRSKDKHRQKYGKQLAHTQMVINKEGSTMLFENITEDSEENSATSVLKKPEQKLEKKKDFDKTVKKIDLNKYAPASFKFSLNSYRSANLRGSTLSTVSKASRNVKPIVNIRASGTQIKYSESWRSFGGQHLSSYVKRKMYDEERRNEDREKSVWSKSSKSSRRKKEKKEGSLPPLIPGLQRSISKFKSRKGSLYSDHTISSDDIYHGGEGRISRRNTEAFSYYY